MIRDQSIDIYKGLLIFLVVFGHVVERFLGWQNEFGKMFLQSIYAVHMPAFIFISGCLFKDQNIAQKIAYFLSLLIPFQVLYVFLDVYYTGQWSLKWLWQPYWLLWYLWAMSAWVILTHWLKRTAYPVVFSVVLAVLIGLSPINNYIFSIGRIFTFLPFFMLGHVYGQRLLPQLKRVPYGFVSALILSVMILIAMQNLSLKSYWLYGSLNYQQMHVTPLQGILQRSAYLTLSLTLLVLLYVLVQKLPHFFAKLGENSLSIYLWHGLLLLWLSHALHLFMGPQAKLVMALVMSIVISMFCMLSIFNQSIQKLSQIFLSVFNKLKSSKAPD